jgi:hypothetical protein
MKRIWKFTLALALLCHSAAPARAGVVAPGAEIGGRTIGEWTAEWWIWGFSFPFGAGPLEDVTGELGYLGDVGGPVFFLGASGGSPVNWTMSVPGGQYILFPLLTGIDWLGDGRTEAQLLADLLAANDGITGLYATLDGVPLTNLSLHRVLSPWFDFFSPDAGFLPMGTYRGIADGYWIMLEPLPAGTHTLSFGGRLDEFAFAADTNVSLTATPEPQSLISLAVGLGVLAAWRRRRMI